MLILQTKLIDMKKLRGKYMGEIIDEFVVLETLIEIVISMYFTNNDEIKEKELRHILLATETFSFNNKKTMLWFIANRFPKYLKENKRLDHKMKGLVSFRNMLIHRKLKCDVNTMKTFDGETIILEGLKTKDNNVDVDELILNQKVVDGIVEKILLVNRMVTDLLMEIYKQNPR
jgi:hypothetical protein